MSKARDLADFISTGSILSDGTIESTEINGVTADASELNVLDGITVTTEELNNVAGISTSVQTQLDGKQDVVAGVSDTEIGYLDGVTSSLQTQLDNISVTSGSLTKSFTSGETASITLAQAISPAPVVSVTKEVPQVGISSKGTWDVNASASNYDLHNTAYDTTLTAVYNTYYAIQNNSAGMSLSSVPNTDFGTGDFTFEAWIYPTTLNSTYHAVVGHQFGGGGGLLYVSNTGLIEFYEAGTILQSSTGLITTNQWYHIAAVRNSGTLKFYLDGSEVASTAYTNNINSTLIYVGRSETTPPGEAFIGYIYKPHVLNIAKYTAAFTPLKQYSTEASSLVLVGSDGTTFSDLLGNSISNNGAAHVNDSPSGASQSNLTLGTGSFASTDVGKRIQGNGGDVTLTSTAGAYSTTGGSAFTDSSTIASGSWSMRGLKSAGDADGIGLAGIVGSQYDFANATLTTTGTINANQGNSISISPDGTKAVFSLAPGSSSTTAKFSSYSMSTPYDLSTLSLTGSAQVPMASTSSFVNDNIALAFKPDGTYAIGVSDESHLIGRYTFSTPWDITTASVGFEHDPGSSYNFASVAWNGDGSKAIMFDVNTAVFYSVNATNYVFSASTNGFAAVRNLPDLGISGQYAYAIQFNSDGTKFYVCNNRQVYEITLSTAYDLTSNTGATQVYDHGSSDINGFAIASDGSSFIYGASGQTTINSYRLQDLTVPTSQYHIGVTNSGGQIDTGFWNDINSMTADQTAGDGTVHYAVSTDDRTTWSVIKEGSGVRPIVRDNSGTWQYNSDAGVTTLNTNISDATYSNKSFDFSTQETGLRSVFFKTDGTSMYSIANGNGGYIHQYSLSTAWDVSSASYANKNFFTGGWEGSPEGFYIKPDGTKAYIVGKSQDAVRRISLSTAWDMSTAAYDGNGISVAGQETALTDIWFKPDGTIMYVIGTANDTVYQYTLSTAWDETTASHEASFSVTSLEGAPSGVTFNAAGTKMYVAGEISAGVHQYTLSTAWDVSTASYDSVLLDASSTASGVQGAVFGDNGSKIYVSAQSGSKVYQYTNSATSYSTSTTWANSTTNDEFYALQQALGYNAFNRMDKTQLDAVTDPNHFTLGDTLDLAIALRMDTASASTPTADGVTINYDAASLNQGAVLGTDYDYDFPDSTTVRVTSNATQNLKIRVV